MKKNMQSFYPFLALERKKCSRALRNPLRTIFLAPCVAMVACMACNSAGRYGINAQPEEKLPAGRTETVENEEAIRNKNLETVQKLLGKQSNVTEEGHDGCVPTSRHEWAIQPRRRIHEAVAKGGVEGLRMLLDNKSNVTEEGHNGCVPTSRRGWDCQTYTYIVNALYEAAAKGDFGEVSELIETNRRNRLYEAAAKGDVEAVSKLLETEYNMDQESQRPTPLSRTAENMEWRNRLYEAAAKENFEEKSKLLEEAAAKRKE